MWLITKIPTNFVSKASDLREEILDLCLGLSPNVSITHDPYVLIDLKSVSRYWNLPTLRKVVDLTDTTESGHPFFDKLRQLHKKFGLEFVMAPTAPWAIALFENASSAIHQSFLRLFDVEEANAAMLKRSLEDNVALLADVFRKKEDKRHEFIEATIELDDLGFGLTQKLIDGTRDTDKKTAFVARFGSLLKKFIKRIEGADDFDMRYYSPSTTLTEKVYIAAATMTASTATIRLPNVPTAGLPPPAVGTPSRASLPGRESARIATSQMALASAIQSAHARMGGPVIDRFEDNTAPTDSPDLEFFTSLTGAPRQLPRLVQNTSSGSEGVLDHLYDVLNKWEDRLSARKSLLRGIIVRLSSDRGKKREEIVVSLPRATRSAESLYKVFFERWIARANRSSQAYLNLEGFEDEIESFEVESMAIEHDHDRQLDLFDPQREDVEEKWNRLIAQLRSRETERQHIRIGSYRANESFLPEQSLKWVEWEDNLNLSPIEDHPKRPLILLRSPQPMQEPRLSNDNEFLKFCEEKRLLTSLEKISDPWLLLADGHPVPRKKSSYPWPATNVEEEQPLLQRVAGERSYVRWQEKWIFWEHRQKRLFLHGYFE